MQMRIQLCNLTARIIMNLHHLTCERLTSFVSVPPQIFASEHFSYMWIADYLKIAAFAMQFFENCVAQQFAMEILHMCAYLERCTS